MKAARYLGVAPWDLANQHPVWMTMALEIESAEIAAHNAAVDRQKKRKP